MSIVDCHLIEFPKFADARGNLTFLEGQRHIPYAIKRVYYLYDVPGGASRAGHAHKLDQQVLIALAGSFDISLDDGIERTVYHMNRCYFGLYVHPLVWRVIDNFSSGAVCLSIDSELYDEADYFREYDDFMKAIGKFHK